MKQVEYEVGRTEQRDIKNGREHVLRLSEIDFLKYLFHGKSVLLRFVFPVPVSLSSSSCNILCRSLNTESCISVAVLSAGW